MSDKTKSSAVPAPKTSESRPSTVNTAPSSSKQVVQSAVKQKSSNLRTKNKLNNTIAGGDISNLHNEGLGCAEEKKSKIRLSPGAANEVTLPNFDEVQRMIAYSKFINAMLEDCLLDEKIEREETQMAIQMLHLASRLKQAMDQLDKTSRRLKDIKFTVEQQRLISLVSQHCEEFYNLTSESKAEDILRDLNMAEGVSLDTLQTKNVDFGYNAETGHKQLLDTINEAIEGLNEIKKHSKLDENKFKQYAEMENKLKELEKDRKDLESLKSDFETKLPQFSQRLLKEASDKIAEMMINDGEGDDSDDD